MTDKLGRPSKNKNEWMIVYTSHDILDAQIVQGRLKHEGIPAFIDHAAGRGAIGVTIGNWGEVRILVHPKTYYQALAVLDTGEPEGLPDELDDTLYDWANEDDDDE